MNRTSRIAGLALIALASIATSLRAAASASEPAADLVEKFMQEVDRAQSAPHARAEVEPTAAIGTGMINQNPREQLAMLANIRDVLGLPKIELSAEESAQLDRVIAFMPKLAGHSGRFDHADLEPIIKSLSEDLEQEVGREIVRQASAKVEAGSFGETLRRRAVEFHLERHGEAYLEHGMEEARSRVRDGLREFLHQTGTASAAPESDERREITLDELKQFSSDARVLQVISRRSVERGLPRFTFPNGMGTDDLKAIRAGEPPPNGKLMPRR